MGNVPSQGERRFKRRAFAVVASLFTLAGVAGAGCGGAKYPLCDNDEGCTADGHTGVCVAGHCVECRDNAGCGAGRTCLNGGCTDIAGYCDKTHACPQGSGCGDDHQCTAVETAPPPFVECDDTKPCGTGSHCQNGHCVMPPQGGPGCTDFPSPHFEYESPDVRSEARETLERLAKCLTTGTLKKGHLLLTGHCDARGEQEFNMSLGDYRAQAVKAALVGLGVPTDKISTSSRGKLDAIGQDEAGWAQDRRVDIEVR